MIDKIDEKIRAIKIAEDCIHSIRTINPDSVDKSVFALLSELKVDLFDMKEYNNPEWSIDIKEVLS